MTNFSSCAAARTRLYALACVAVAPPEPWQREWLLRRVAPLAQVLGERLPFPAPRAQLLGMGRGLRLAPLIDLKAEHQRLDRLAPPYESHYRDPDGLLMGDATGAVVQAYREAGLAPAAGWGDLPDHLGAELEFMTHMAGRETGYWRRGQGQLATLSLDRQEHFLREHLGRWITAYANRVRGAEPPAYYRFLVGLLEETVRLDLHWVTSLRRHLGPAEGQGAGAAPGAGVPRDPVPARGAGARLLPFAARAARAARAPASREG